MNRALDVLWSESPDDDGMVSLREHVIRLCLAADIVERRPGCGAWAAISSNLHMAASLTDVGADTDLRGSSYMCSSAADYDDALSDLTRKHLACVIVFTLCWTAYEGAVEIAGGPNSARQPKGALGRDLLRDSAPADIPYLRACLDASLAFAGAADPELARCRQLVIEGQPAAAAAEFLRCFRNKLIHGSLERPEPEDWGPGTTYVVDEDPAVRRFRHHVRITLLLTQMLLADVVAPAEEIPSWSNLDMPSEEMFGGEPRPAVEVLSTLHCQASELPLFK